VTRELPPCHINPPTLKRNITLIALTPVLTLLPPILTAWIFLLISKCKLSFKARLYIYAVFAFLTNFFCYLVILIFFSGIYVIFTPASITASWAIRYISVNFFFSAVLSCLIYILHRRGYITVEFKDKSDTKKRRFNPVFIALLLISELLLLLALLIIFANTYVSGNWGVISTAEIVFQLSVPLSGVSTSLILLFLRDCILPTILLMAYINFVFFFYSRNEIKILLFLPVAIAFLGYGVWITDKNFDLTAVYDQFASPSTFIEENYVDPNGVVLTFPEQKRNLIYIIVESLEISMMSKDLGGEMPANLIPGITELMRDNVFFSNTDGFGGVHTLTSGITSFSLISQTAGIPVLAANAPHGNLQGRNNAILPNAESLGKILESNGYTNIFMIGSDAAFGGRDIYFRGHGNYRLYDYKYARREGVIPEGYHVSWGFEDEKLYQWAKNELPKLAAEDVPFNLTMLTVDTHHPYGYICNLCTNYFNERLHNVIACADRQLSSFVSWLTEQDFFENTTVVIIGDHPSMDNDYTDSLSIGYHERMLPVIFINTAATPINSHNRVFSLYDMFPTTLAALGVEIEGNRLALGVNLFSDERTLLEIHPLYTVLEEVRKLSIFYNETFW